MTTRQKYKWAQEKNLKEFTIQCITYLLLCLWIVVSSRKLFDYTSFRQAMIDQPFEDQYGVLLSYLLPVQQLTVALLFIFEKTRRYGFWLTILFMGIYSGYILLVLNRIWGFIPCGCTLEFPVDWIGHLWINVFIFMTAGTALLLDKKRPIKIGNKKY